MQNLARVFARSLTGFVFPVPAGPCVEVQSQIQRQVAPIRQSGNNKSSFVSDVHHVIFEGREGLGNCEVIFLLEPLETQRH